MKVEEETLEALVPQLVELGWLKMAPDVLRPRRSVVVEQHLGAAAGELLGHVAAHAARGAGDDGHLAIEADGHCAVYPPSITSSAPVM